MKKIAIVIFIILGCNIFIGKAQERGFQISGKIDGILEGTLFLMSDEKGKLEVLDTTSIMNGAFVFTGKVERPLSAYIMVPNSKNYIPLIYVEYRKNRCVDKGGRTTGYFESI